MSKDIANQLFLVYLGRPADVSWRKSTADFVNNAAPSVALQNAFFSAAVLEGVYSLSDSPAFLVNKIFQNIFGFGANGYEQQQWGDLITKGVITAQTAAWTIFNSYLGATNLGTLADTYQVPARSKLIAIDAYTTELANNGAANAAVSQIGGAGASAARATIAGVTSAATAAGVQSTITTIVTTVSTATTGSTYTLTTGVDTPIGTSGNDLFNAPAGTFSSLDKIDGGNGTDTLNWTETTAVTTAPVSAALTSVERITFTSNEAYTIDLTGTTFSGSGLISFAGTNAGAKNVVLTGAATTDLSVTNASLATGTITVNGGKAVTVSVGEDIASGDTGGAIGIGATTAAAGPVTVTNAFTSANTTAAGTSVATAGAINVTGGTVINVSQTITPTSAAATTVLTSNTTVRDVAGAVTVNGNASTTDVTVTQSAGVTAVASGTIGRIGITNGAVTITDANSTSTTAAGTIKTVTITNAAAATVNSGALTTLNLGGTLTTVDAGTLGALSTPTNNTLALNLTGAVSTGAVTIDTDITTLNVTGSTTASTLASLVANGATKINVAGDAKITFTDNTIGAATDITVTNTAGAAFGTTALGNSVNFTGGAGADAVVLGATTKAIVMGAGNDTVTTTTGTVGTGGSVAAGDGTDTIIMTSALAGTASGSSVFNSKFTGFEVLRVSDALANTLDLDGINSVASVILAAGSNNQTINNLVSGGTVQTNASATTGLTIGVKSALIGSSDVLNLALSSNATIAAGTVTAANVETINISAPDSVSAGSNAVIHTMTLAATSATTVTVSGNNGLTLTNTGNTAITKFDASGVVANNTPASTFVAATSDTAANLAVTFASANITASANVSITGGAGNDVLTGNVAKDTISGGAGADAIYGDNAGTKEVQAIAATVSNATGASTIAVNLYGISVTTASLAASSTAATVGGAIKTAIDGNADLAKLVTVSVGGTGAVIVTSLVDGDAPTLTVTPSAAVTSGGTVTTTNPGTAGAVATDTLDGGAGADFLVGGGGADIITTGAGADVVFFLKGHSTLANMATITDYTFVAGGTSNDKIIIGDQTAAIGSTTTVQDLSSSASLTAAADAAALANTVANDGLSVFIWGGNEYAYVESVSSGTAYVAGDFIVKLTGTPLAAGALIAGSGFDAV